MKMDIDKITGFCKEKGFLFPSSHIYGGLKGVFDYGPLGTQLKQNILQQYWNYFLIPHDNIVSQDGSIMLNEKVLEASGHVKNFNDPVAISTKGERMRADHLLEEHFPNMKAETMSYAELLAFMQETDIRIGNDRVAFVEEANLMFSTKTFNGPKCYLRPETCQNIFVNAKLVADLSRLTLPFGICQHGKVFRNEISPQNFVFRCREFEQLELEFFFNPSLVLEPKVAHFEIACSFANGENRLIQLEELIDRVHFWHLHWMRQMLVWLTQHIGLTREKLRLREHHPDELSHYSSATFDVEYLYPIGQESSFKELCGLANRGDYDVSQHAKYSSKNLKFKCPQTGDKLYPHVIELSIGMERLFLAVICDAYEFNMERDYEVLHLKESLSPIEYAIFPLPSKNHEKQLFLDCALDIQSRLKLKHKHTFYETTGSIGKRYARQDSRGTKWCITVDDMTLECRSITIRDRDDKSQRRINIDDFFNEL